MYFCISQELLGAHRESTHALLYCRGAFGARMFLHLFVANGLLGARRALMYLCIVHELLNAHRAGSVGAHDCICVSYMSCWVLLYLTGAVWLCILQELLGALGKYVCILMRHVSIVVADQLAILFKFADEFCRYQTRARKGGLTTS